MQDIVSFLQSSGEQVTTSAIVNHFRDRTSAEDSQLFKSMLNEAATFNKKNRLGRSNAIMIFNENSIVFIPSVNTTVT